MEPVELILEVLKIVVMPSSLLFASRFLTKSLEKPKIDLLKEKEWQVKWAEFFLSQAVEFNEKVSIAIYSIHYLAGPKIEDRNKVDKLNQDISISYNRMREIHWHIQSYSQFSGDALREKIGSKQIDLIDAILKYTMEKKGNLEEIRIQQFEYNKAVREAHSEILKMK